MTEKKYLLKRRNSALLNNRDERNEWQTYQWLGSCQRRYFWDDVPWHLFCLLALCLFSTHIPFFLSLDPSRGCTSYQCKQQAWTGEYRISLWWGRIWIWKFPRGNRSILLCPCIRVQALLEQVYRSSKCGRQATIVLLIERIEKLGKTRIWCTTTIQYERHFMTRSRCSSENSVAKAYRTQIVCGIQILIMSSKRQK
jgi:hypothetical protein